MDIIKWIIPGKLAAGESPTRHAKYIYNNNKKKFHVITKKMMNPYFRDGIKAVLSLSTDPLPQKEIKRYGFDYLHIPTQDMHAPDNLREICIWISSKADYNKPVFIHCDGGIGRTGTVLAAYLMWCGIKITAYGALVFIKKNYNIDAIESNDQYNALQGFQYDLYDSVGEDDLYNEVSLSEEIELGKRIIADHINLVYHLFDKEFSDRKEKILMEFENKEITHDEYIDKLIDLNELSTIVFSDEIENNIVESLTKEYICPDLIFKSLLSGNKNKYLSSIVSLLSDQEFVFSLKDSTYSYINKHHAEFYGLISKYEQNYNN